VVELHVPVVKSDVGIVSICRYDNLECDDTIYRVGLLPCDADNVVWFERGWDTMANQFVFSVQHDLGVELREFAE